MPRLSAVDSQIAMSESYDARAGLTLPIGRNPRVLSAVEMFESERIDRVDTSLSSVKRYATARIYELFGLSYTEFIDLPTYMCTFMYEVAEERNLKSSKTIQDLENAMGDKGSGRSSK